MSKATLDFSQPVPPAVEEDDLALAAIDKGIQAADEDRTISLEEARKLIPEWIAKFGSRTRR